METIDELKERQEAEILKVRTEQLKLWESLQRQYGKGQVPEDVIAEFGRSTMKENIDLADKLLEERKAVPYYGSILAVEDQITTELRASYDDLQMLIAAEKNQEELDESQDDMIALMAKIRKGNEPVGY